MKKAAAISMLLLCIGAWTGLYVLLGRKGFLCTLALTILLLILDTKRKAMEHAPLEFEKLPDGTKITFEGDKVKIG